MSVPFIAFLGPSGTYAETACHQLAQAQGLRDHTPRSGLSIQHVLHQLKADHGGDGTVVAAVVPVENSVQGGVTATLDTLWSLSAPCCPPDSSNPYGPQGLEIVRGLVLPIRHALLGSARTEDISEVISHPQALGQCSTWLNNHLPQALQLPTTSTAEAARMVKGSRFRGAIASLDAAREQDLSVLAYPINDEPNNCTRFLLVQPVDATTCSSAPSTPPDHTVMTSLCFALRQRDRPGALVEALQVFHEQALNMSRIESRPAKTDLGKYVFFVDVEGHYQTAAFQKALHKLYPICEQLLNFGSYPVMTVSPEESEAQFANRRNGIANTT
ncbi:prephenate dehydratase [Candidatus Synechococcus spongiarum]|uniref:Prephenate dehydratase n=1 Tax=Candidatus Synechococcus spongiarum LMB bulk15N TaxID=1943583 RepID=A0A1T1D1S0_9SYNE|nr:prephenate dehydratase [Candidatus Synechococcus spongiarum]OOV34816.1 hypothetical protein BV53_04955 [Candidatus Synechococcus spongiarum LMB bulk15N]